jgi:hypothetical protein
MSSIPINSSTADLLSMKGMWKPVLGDQYEVMMLRIYYNPTHPDAILEIKEISRKLGHLVLISNNEDDKHFGFMENFRYSNGGVYRKNYNNMPGFVLVVNEEIALVDRNNFGFTDPNTFFNDYDVNNWIVNINRAINESGYRRLPVLKSLDPRNFLSDAERLAKDPNYVVVLNN